MHVPLDAEFDPTLEEVAEASRVQPVTARERALGPTMTPTGRNAPVIAEESSGRFAVHSLFRKDGKGVARQGKREAVRL